MDDSDKLNDRALQKHILMTRKFYTKETFMCVGALCFFVLCSWFSL